MTEPVTRPSLIPIAAFCAALGGMIVCLVLCVLWVSAERELGEAKVKLARALPNRGQAGEANDQAAAPDVVALRDEVKKMRAELKNLKAKQARASRRSYGPEQATGEPDVPTPGDSANAWCPLTANGQVEWLVLEYEEPLTIAAVKVHENYGTGALTQIAMVDPQGRETPIWTGQDPTRAGGMGGVSIVPINGTRTSNRIKIYLTPQAAGTWVEIDAVGIVTPDGKSHWATGCEASSTYGDPQYRAQAPVLQNGAVQPGLAPQEF